MRDSKGFSLFEVAAVAAVVLALSAITVPGMYSVYNSYRLSSTTQAVSATLQSARARAMRDNKPVTVIFNASIHQFGIDENDNGRLEPEESFVVPEGISFKPYASITFMPNGELPPGVTAMAVTISNNSESRSINVLPDGQTEIS
ncbi:MAG TPA: GspH/FimT family pseudopilin [Blastocatellia bacterium]|nr:GspH/FimT family pseudopilin [Blastocatellia bacterium]